MTYELAFDPRALKGMIVKKEKAAVYHDANKRL